MNVEQFIEWLDANTFERPSVLTGALPSDTEPRYHIVRERKGEPRFYFRVSRCEFGPIIYDKDTSTWRWWCANNDMRFFDEDPRELLNKALTEQWVLANRVVEQAMDQRSQIYKVLQQTRT